MRAMVGAPDYKLWQCHRCPVSVFTRANSNKLLKCSGEMRLAGKAGSVSNLCQRESAVTQESFGSYDSAMHNVLMRASARTLFEELAKIVRTDARLSS